MQRYSGTKYLPEWILPDDETVDRDAIRPTDSYLYGVKEATHHRYKYLITDPQHHIYNLLDEYSGGFVHTLKLAYSNLRESEKLKFRIPYLYSQDNESWDEYRFWSHAPMQFIARRVGERALPGLHAISLLTGDWALYNEFLNWFLGEWLPEADEIAKKYHQTPRYISRTEPMYHEIAPHLDEMRDALIHITDQLHERHPLLFASYKKISKEDFLK